MKKGLKGSFHHGLRAVALGRIAGDEDRVEAVALLDEVVVQKVDQHVHAPPPDLGHVDLEGGEGRADDVGVLRPDEGEDFDVFRDLEAAVGGRVLDGRGNRVAVADEVAFAFLLDDVLEVVVGPRVAVVAVEDVIRPPEGLVGIDEGLLAVLEEAAAVMDVEEGHLLLPALLVVILDELDELVLVGEEDAADLLAHDLVVDDDGRDRVAIDLHDILGVELVVEDDGPVDVGRDDPLDHGEGFLVAMGGREEGEDEAFFLGDLADAVQHVGDVDVVGRRNDDADVGRLVGREGLGEAAWLIAEPADRFLDPRLGIGLDVAFVVDDPRDGR